MGFFLLRYFGFSFFLFIFLISGCGNKENQEPFCEISFVVETDKFYQGCTVPISVKAGNGSNQNVTVQLFINEIDMGLVKTAPSVYYWETNKNDVGEKRIRAVYTSIDNLQATDEKIIELLPTTADCPDEIIDIDGNHYPVIQIGNQCWMQKNLKTTHYANGEELINGLDSIHESGPTELPGWYFAYDRDTGNVDTYGYLYTWSTTMKGNKAADEDSGPIQGICPNGWHVPDVNEWKTLIDFSGGVRLAAANLKDTTSVWSYNPPNSSNSTGFSALPGGTRIWAGSYVEKGTGAYFWTATETIPNHAYHIFLKSDESKVFVLGHQDSKRFGYSVRCVKD